MNSFYELQRLLGRWPEIAPSDTPFDDPVHDRLRRALRGLAEDRTGPGDLAGLIAHVLAREDVRIGLTARPPAEFTTPREPPWPSKSMWAEYGVTAIPQGTSQNRLHASTWRPTWLSHNTESPTTPALREEPRRHDARVPADPAVAALLRRGDLQYISPGQRAAVRAAFLMRPGSTLLVSLPTGGGKSLVFQAVALAAHEVGTLTVVIVPTIALACDQGRRFAELIDEPGAELAYHGGLSNEARAAMRGAIRTGTQRIVFASPETVLGALRLALLDAASQGRLRNLVIDEAHLVAQWGAEFRPAFQMIAGLRDMLRARCPEGSQLRTLMLTATLTHETWWVLRTLFGEIEVVSAVHLRPEPEHWIGRAPDEETRVDWLKEAVRRVPRPFVLYTSRRDDADAWHARLRALGMRRVGCLKGGDASTDEGGELLRAWAARELDAVVATAAFGLGVDQGDVRAVLHACVPETVDRYYQEVGRAGRDGRAAFALMVYTPPDLQLARTLSDERVIGVEKGLGRWTTMFQQRRDLGADRCEVPLDAIPPWVMRDGRENEAWNRRALLLMARMGMIRLSLDGPVQLSHTEGESEEAYDTRCDEELARCFRRSVVEIRDAGHLDRSNWEQLRGAERSRGTDDDALMEQVVGGTIPLATIFNHVYLVAECGVVPERAEPGCPASRRDGRRFDGYVEPAAAEARRIVGVGDPTGLVSGLHCVSLPALAAIQPALFQRRIETLLERLVARGVHEVAVGSRIAAWPRVRDLWKHTPGRFVVLRALEEREPPGGGSPLRRVTVLGPELPDDWWRLFELDRPGHVLVIPDTLPDPARRERRYVDLHPQTLSLDEYLTRLDR